MTNNSFIRIFTLLLLFPVSCPLSSATDSLITPVTENPDVEQQMKGDYPELERVEAQPLGAIQHAWDKAPPTAGVYQVIYRPHEVIRLRTREYMTTTVILPIWEQVNDMIVGDESAYEVRQLKPHLILLRPKEFVGIDSTLTLIGASGRIYSFYLRTEGYNSRHVADISVYVKVPLVDQRSDARDRKNPLNLDYLEDAYVNPSELSFAFTMAGDAEIAPERVYSDGIRTWFDYGSTIHQKSLPTIYKVEDGIDMPINVNRDGTKLVAQAVGDFCLKHGTKIVCVMAEP